MKSSTPSYTYRKNRRENVLRRMEKFRAAKERKRIERVKDEPIRQETRGRHCYTFTIHDRHRGVIRSIDLYVSEKRINSYRVMIGGTKWKDAISMTALLSALRKKMPPMRHADY